MLSRRMEADRTALAISSVAPHRPVHRRFYIAIAIVTIIIGVGGFAPSLVDTTTRHAALTPLVAVHGASGGSVTGLELQAAARSDGSPTIHRRFGIAVFLRDFSGTHQRRAEADGSRHLVNTNHRHDQGLKGDPPFRERPPGELCERQRHPRL